MLNNTVFPSIFEPFSKEISAGFVGKPVDFSLLEPKENFLDYSKLSIIHLKQTHSDITLDALNINSQTECDGVFTQKKNIVCTVNTADCIGGLFYNPVKNEVAAVHAGWKGLAQKIFSKYLLTYSREEIQNFRVALSPSLGPCCSEFTDPYSETPPHFHPYIISRDEKYFVDLWSIAEVELLSAGLKKEHIQLPEICTKCNNNRWWSFRSGDITQRNMSWIYLR